MGDKPDSRRSVVEANAAWGVISLLLAGMLTWGGIGYLVDHWLGTDLVFVPIGLIVGIAGAFYLVYRRYGRLDGETTESGMTERRD